MNAVRLQTVPAIPAVRGPNQTQMTLPYQVIPSSAIRQIPPGARFTLPPGAPINNQNFMNLNAVRVPPVRLQATIGPNGQPQRT